MLKWPSSLNNKECNELHARLRTPRNSPNNSSTSTNHHHANTTTTTTTTMASSSLHSHSNRNTSPRQHSPRKNMHDNFFRIFIRYSHWVLLVLMLTFVSVHWQIVLDENSTDQIREARSDPGLGNHLHHYMNPNNFNNNRNINNNFPPPYSTHQSSATSRFHERISALGRKYDAHLLPPSKSIVLQNGDSRMQNAGGGRSTQFTDPQLALYSPQLHPVIPSTIYRPISSQPLRVIFVGRQNDEDDPLFMTAASSSSLHYMPSDLLLDGLDRSKYIKVVQSVTYDPVEFTITSKVYHSIVDSEPLLIVVDWAGLTRDCHVLERLWESTEILHNITVTTVQRTNVYLLYVDFSASYQTVICNDRSGRTLLPRERTRVARRSIVQGRYWNQTQQWIEPGRLLPQAVPVVPAVVMEHPILHVPYFLREAFVEQLVNVTTWGAAAGSAAATWSIEEVVRGPRKTDLSHFWRKGDYSHYSFLRRLVGEQIMAYDRLVPEKHTRWVVRIMGDEEHVQLHQVEEAYVTALLSSKVVVIAQKDEWEDHYRLLESMASGALVLSDAMVAPPAGLINGTNIVFYDSAVSLRRLIHYYLNPEQEEERLSIAQKGMEYALGSQRSWHAFERLLFGKPLTQVDKPVELSPKRKHPPKVDARRKRQRRAQTEVENA